MKQRPASEDGISSVVFPIAFLQALEPNEVVVLNDGADGQPARIKVSGEGNDLITLTKVLNLTEFSWCRVFTRCIQRR